MSAIKTPRTLVEAVRYFADEEVTFQFVRKLRWPGEVACPFCAGEQHAFIKTRRIWQCKGCGKQFSVKKGTIFEDSPIKLDKWLIAMWLIANAKNGISSYELGRSLGITQKSAWFMLHRIRLAMQNGSIEKLTGEVEIDEMYYGGKQGNDKHSKDELETVKTKTMVLGILERDGEVRTKVVRNNRRRALVPHVLNNVEPGAEVYTDALQSYDVLGQVYQHASVNHKFAFVDGKAHTNGLENFWSQVKRTLSGTYVSVEPFHLQAYMDEAAFRFNLRKGKDGNRFETAVGSVQGKRLTYRQLTGKEVAAA